MFDPLNQLPADPEWVKLVDKLTAEASEKLGCLVVLIAAQDGGKLAVSAEGGTPRLVAMANEMPRFLSSVAAACYLSDSLERTQKS